MLGKFVGMILCCKMMDRELEDSCIFYEFCFEDEWFYCVFFFCFEGEILY